MTHWVSGVNLSRVSTANEPQDLNDILLWRSLGSQMDKIIEGNVLCAIYTHKKITNHTIKTTSTVSDARDGQPV